ncbi:MAG TPA: toxin-antitoxin system protein [Candidatus Scatomonas merdavium]|nr:toxin-antitoxin system protein [Candidatus Scatomonas merdavium]
MSTKPLKTKVSITLDESVVETVKELAEEDDRNFSQYINWILKEWIKNKKKGAEK